MSELVSSVELKKADGNPIKFNFQFENGLPIKPVINATYKEGIHNKEKIPVLIVYLNKEEEKPSPMIVLITSKTGGSLLYAGHVLKEKLI